MTTADLLAGVKVLDLSQGLAGPYCGAILRRQGADVIKVEPPAGDWARGMGAQRGGFSSVVVVCNAGKRSACIDATTADGRAVLLRMAQRADILIQNFRPGVVARLGLDYDALATTNPGIVYLSISGFGTSGPDVALPATDTVMQARTGMMAMNADASGMPRRVGIFLADLSAALYASQAASAALYRRAIEGTGRHIELSLLEACAALQSCNIADRAFAVEGAGAAPSAPSGVFRTADGHVVMSMLNNDMFARLAAALVHEEWLQDPRFASTTSRLKHAAEINSGVAEALRDRSTADCTEALTRYDVLHSPVLDYDALLDDRQMRHCGIVGLLDQPGVGPIPLTRLPGGEAPLSPAPRIGEHTRAVLADFGFAEGEIDGLIASKAARPAA